MLWFMGETEVLLWMRMTLFLRLSFQMPNACYSKSDTTSSTRVNLEDDFALFNRVVCRYCEIGSWCYAHWSKSLC
jgi:hypothetical protein